MITITMYQNKQGRYTGFSCIGHAGYASAGEDIVCAGVSALVLNTINAVDAFTQDAFDANTDQKTGLIDIRFHHPVGHDVKLLLDTMALGLRDIQKNYGTDHCLIEFKEV